MTTFIKSLIKEEIKSSSIHIDLYTDSKYVMNGITQWIAGWKKKNLILHALNSSSKCNTALFKNYPLPDWLINPLYHYLYRHYDP
jgi:ribonuclease HI